MFAYLGHIALSLAYEVAVNQWLQNSFLIYVDETSDLVSITNENSLSLTLTWMFQDFVDLLMLVTVFRCYVCIGSVSSESSETIITVFER